MMILGLELNLIYIHFIRSIRTTILKVGISYQPSFECTTPIKDEFAFLNCFSYVLRFLYTM